MVNRSLKYLQSNTYIPKNNTGNTKNGNTDIKDIDSEELTVI